MGDPPATSRTRGGIIMHNRGASWSRGGPGAVKLARRLVVRLNPSGGVRRVLGPGWEDLSSGTIASMAPRRRRWGRERRSEAPGALRSRPLVARGAHREGRAQPARSAAGPGATGRASDPEATARRDCCRRTGSPQGPDRADPSDCSRTGPGPGGPQRPRLRETARSLGRGAGRRARVPGGGGTHHLVRRSGAWWSGCSSRP
jgi:hypothetical protein